MHFQMQNTILDQNSEILQICFEKIQWNFEIWDIRESVYFVDLVERFEMSL